jgi:recombination protein RecA
MAAAALPSSTIAAKNFRTIEAKLVSLEQDHLCSPFPSRESKELLEVKGPHEIAGVFRGRELTRKERRLTCGITPIDNLIGGGIVRGRISEIVGLASVGKTTLAASFAAAATCRGEIVAWIDASGNFDPASTAAAGVDLARMLWVAMPVTDKRRGYRARDEFEGDCSGLPRVTEEFVRGEREDSRPEYLIGDKASRSNSLFNSYYSRSDNHSDSRSDSHLDGRFNSHSDSYSAAGYRVRRSAGAIVLKATEWILAAGGFGLVVIDCGNASSSHIAFMQSAALRLARGAERSGAAVLIIGSKRMCGTFAALSLMLSRTRACFSRTTRQAPSLFDGLAVEARVMRNKLGSAGGAADWRALIDASCPPIPELALRFPAFSFDSPDSSATPPNAGRRATAR